VLAFAVNAVACSSLLQELVVNVKAESRVKAEHLYSTLHGAQTTAQAWITQFNLQRTPCLPLPRKHSPDGDSTECGGEHLIPTHFSFIDPERIKG